MDPSPASQSSSASQSSTQKPAIAEERDPNRAEATITEVENQKSVTDESRATSNIEGASLDLFLGGFLPCLPVILVTALLLTLIFRHRVDLDPGWLWLQSPTTTASINNASLSTLQLRSKGGDAAYYIRFNPAVLAAIAAWTSKIIPWFTGSSMAVVAFFASRRILNATRNNEAGQLPTPHQTSILINTLSGSGAKPLWDTFLYRWNNHEKIVQPLPLAFGALAYIVIITLLIGAADTWFAATTKPENVNLLARHITPENAFGRGLRSSACGDDIWDLRSCPSNTSSMCKYPCSIDSWNITTSVGPSMKEGIKGAQQSADTLLGNSIINMIQNTSYQTNQQGYDAQQYHFLGDYESGFGLDFLADTVSVSTQCMMATQICNISSTDEGFSCPGGFKSPSFTYSGAVGVDPMSATGPNDMSMVGIQFFKDAGLTSPIGFGNQTTELFSAQNPINFLAWSKGFPPVDASSQTFAEMNAGKYLQLDQSGDNVFILNCSSTIYSTVYAWVNGTILKNGSQSGFYPTLAPDTFGTIISAPFAINSALGHLALQDAAALAAYKPDPQDVASVFANQFSRAAIALSSGIMAAVPNRLEQSRNNTELLTRVPKVPLYFLISLQALYAFISLMMVALVVLLTRPFEANEVKARLTINGLAAGLFEPGITQEKPVKTIDELYTEHREVKKKEVRASKVGLRQTRTGGWKWMASGNAQKAWTSLGAGGGREGGGNGSVDGGEMGRDGKEHDGHLKEIM